MDRPAGSSGAVRTAGTYVFRSCLAVLVVCLALVVVAWIWLVTEPGRNEDAARADLREGVRSHTERLAGAAADGRLTDTEIAAHLGRSGPSRGLLAVDRKAGTVRITAELWGAGPGFLLTHETIVEGCYVFDVTPDQGGKLRVAARETADERCRTLARTTPPAPAPASTSSTTSAPAPSPTSSTNSMSPSAGTSAQRSD
ncbi:hypothetical protein [Streptomyces sp. NPDC057287]|uniref:hypothetical protein n=1 Tax=Streptomyces sp. NPDC057287 TaxID=3346086 RepID=UPI00362DB1EA